MSVILTPYFTKDVEYSQHDSSGGCRCDDLTPMLGWYNSVIKCGLTAVVFHNEIPDQIVKKWSCANVSFSYYGKQHRPSYNDERFYCYRQYLTKHPEVDMAICTDIFDVRLLGNPFDLFAGPYDLFVGSEDHPSRRWINRKYKSTGIKPLPPGLTLYNAGIIGGHRGPLLELLGLMVGVFETIPRRENANMCVLNHCLHRLYRGRVFTGYPLHNVFGSKKARDGVRIKHK